VLFGSDPAPWHAAAGEWLAKNLSPDDLVVISTDLSHYMNERDANRIDKHSLDRVLSKDLRALASENESGECALCGATAVVAGMAYALAAGANDWTLLDYRTSAAASGDYERVVGYGAISMERPA
jgi:AmmeMemoRadiSam system protein B